LGHSRRSDQGPANCGLPRSTDVVGRIVIRRYESIRWRVAPSAAGNSCMRAMRKLPVVPICRRYRRLRRRANQNDLLAHPASMKRDVRAVVTTREAGMRWTRRARQTNVAGADGEVAWSRPPDAEVKLAMMLRITLATGARKPGPRGDRDISGKPSRRECRLIRLNLWWTAACFFYLQVGHG